MGSNTPYIQTARSAPRSGEAAERTGQKEPQTASKKIYHLEGATNRKRVTAQRPQGAKYLRDAI